MRWVLLIALLFAGCSSISGISDRVNWREMVYGNPADPPDFSGIHRAEAKTCSLHQIVDLTPRPPITDVQP